MAASMRLRLHFDGSVCTQISPRKCWFLVNLDNCNVVADLEYLIRERFELDRGLKLSLYLDGFLIPSMEKIHVVRDNDTLWVKLSEIDDRLLQGSDEPSTSPCEAKAPLEEDMLHHLDKKQQKGLKRKVKKSKSSSRDLEVSPTRHKVNKLNPAKHVNHSDDRDDVDSSNLQTQGKRRQHEKKDSIKKKKKIVGQPDGRQKTPAKHSSAPNDVDLCSSSLEKNPRSKDPKKKTKVQQKSGGTSLGQASDSVHVVSNAKRTDERGRENVTASNVSGNNFATKVQMKKSANASKANHQSVLKSNANASEGDEHSGSVSSVSAAESSTAPLDGTANVANTNQDGTRRSSTSMTGQSSSHEGSTHNFAVDKGSSKRTVYPSSNHIRFESSESESDSSSSDEDSGETDEETSNQQANRDQIDKDKVSVNSSDETSQTTNPLSTKNKTAEKLASTPSESHIPEFQSPPNNQLPKDGSSQKNSSPSSRRTSNARGRGLVPWNRGNWDKKSQTKQSDKSVTSQDAPEEPVPPPKDFTSFPSLVGPPRQGDVIAYKILELSESYCPELSDYKEAKVLSVDAVIGQIEVQLSSATMATRPSKPGKFDLQWGQEDADDTCSKENSMVANVCVQLRDLVDPRLVPSTSSVE